MNKKAYYISLSVFLFIIFILVIFEVIALFFFAEAKSNNLMPVTCEKSEKVWAMWNNETAMLFNMTPEIMANITYAYTFDYEISCPKNVKDCFINIPVEKCCTYDKKSLLMYCRDTVLYNNRSYEI